MIREASPDDLAKLCSLSRRFVAESGLPLSYDAAKARETLWTLIHDESIIFLVYDNDGEIAGTVVGAVDRDFCYESMAYVMKFYVERDYRGTGISRELVEGFERVAKEKGADMVFASATAGMGQRNETLYVRLFEKYGYNVLGRILMKELSDG